MKTTLTCVSESVAITEVTGEFWVMLACIGASHEVLENTGGLLFLVMYTVTGMATLDRPPPSTARMSN